MIDKPRLISYPPHLGFDRRLKPYAINYFHWRLYEDWYT
jgi:hypothetical protein